MKIFNTVASVFICLSLAACSSTNTANNESQMADNYYTNNFSHTQFSAMHKNSVKKSLSTDHQLMMSLLSRPITEDRAMMLAFAQERASYAPSYTQGIAIKGEKADDDDYRNQHPYADLIAQDTNAILISAPH